MKPYFETENGVLYCGDCLEVMQNINDIDLILTDPPYGINYRSLGRKKKHKKIKNDNNLNWLPYFFKISYSILNNNSHAYFFAPYQKIDTFISLCRQEYKIKNILIWMKNNRGMGDLKCDYAPQYEPIIFCCKGVLSLNGKRDSNILQFNKTNNIYHPTQKPETLFNYLIQKSTKIGETVLDPFAGSGTTALAAEDSSRKWICIECDEEYCEITANRVLKLKKQKKLFEGY